MKKLGILMMVCLLAAAGIMGALAYNNATVRSDSTLSVVSSDQALLSVIPADHTLTGKKDFTANVREDGVVEFIFGRGLNMVDYGLQPGSQYKWDNLFYLTNNSNEKLEVQFEIEDPIREYISIRKSTNPPGQVFTRNQWKNSTPQGRGISFSMEPGSTHKFDVTMTLPLDTDPAPGQRAAQPGLGLLKGQIKVIAKAVE